MDGQSALRPGAGAVLGGGDRRAGAPPLPLTARDRSGARRPPPAGNGRPETGGGRQRLIATLVTCAVLAIVVWRVLPAFGDYGEAWMLVRRMPAAGLAALTVTVAANVGVFPWPLQTCLPGLSYRAAFVVRQTSFLLANTVPAGGAVAVAVQYAALADVGVATAPATAAITLTALWNLLIMLALPALAVAALLVSHGPGPQELLAAGVGFAGVAVLAALLVAVLRDETAARRIGARFDRLATRIPRPGPGGGDPGAGAGAGPQLAERLVAIRAATVRMLRTRPLALTLSSLGVHALQVAILMVAVRGLPGSAATAVSAAEVLAAVAFARLASFVPVTPNGLGTVDAGLVGLLVAFGADGDEALAAVLVWRVATTLPQVVIGTGTFLYWRQRLSVQPRRALPDDAVPGGGGDNP